MSAISPTDDEVRRRVVDRVIDLGGEVLCVEVEHGAVRLRGRVGEPRQMALARDLLRRIDGVDSVVAQFTLFDEVCNEPTRG